MRSPGSRITCSNYLSLKKEIHMPIDPELASVLACPVDKGVLHILEDENSLYNTRLQRRYTVRDSIAVMLVDESEIVSTQEHERIMAKIAAGGIKTTGR